MAIRRARSRLRGVAGSIGPALWLLAGIGFISQVGISVMLPLLPLYATELGAPPFVLGLLTAGATIGIVIGSVTAELWTRIDITAGMLVGVVAPLVTVAAMLAFRSRPLPSPV